MDKYSNIQDLYKIGFQLKKFFMELNIPFKTIQQNLLGMLKLK